jgi:SAM-dependent methyltransferase
MKTTLQVHDEHYNHSYDTLERFNSYFHQIKIIHDLDPEKILEIGIGNKTVSNYLKDKGSLVSTCDFDERLEPDYIADIQDLPFSNNSFDCVMACQVLEHLPWQAIDVALRELKRVSKKYIVISIPDAATLIRFMVKTSILWRFLKKDTLTLSIRIPKIFKTKPSCDEHFWEMGLRHFSKRKIRRKLLEYFKISSESSPIMNTYHYFFILENYEC